MKTVYLSKGLLTVLLILVIVSSCQKDLDLPAQNLPEINQGIASGVVPDDPVAVSYVPLIVSSDFITNGGLMAEGISSEQFRGGRGGNNNTSGGGGRGGGKPSKNVTDTIAPSLSITAPSNGSTVSGTVNVTVNVTDNVSVSSVSLSVDGGSTVSSSNSSPYSNTWNSGTVANGTHTLTVTARDGAGNQTSKSIQVNVNNVVPVSDIIAPTVAINSPASQASVTGTVTVSISATDNVGVSSVSISIDGAVVSNSTSYSWNTSNYTSGTHTISATAKDAAGNQGSKSISVNVNTVVVPPPPPSTEVSLAMPPVGNQGSEGSCVAFAVGYGARSVDKYYKAGASSYSMGSNVFSPEFLFNQVKFGSDCYQGTAMQTALDFIVANGICTYSSMPYSSTNGCSLMPNNTQSAEALNYKITGGYSKVYATDKSAIKSLLNSKKAIIITITADNSFINAKSGFIWKTYSGSGSLPHCIVICGYDDSKNAYKIMNSWGNSWCDSGFGWIDYDFLPTKSTAYGFVIN